MKLTGPLMRRTVAAAALTSAAILIPAVALASPGAQSAAKTAVAPHCTKGQLTAWLGVPGSGAAGSSFYQLEISNISRHACTLYGYPGVSAFTGSHQLGSAAGRDPSHPSRFVTLSPQATAHAILQITDVYNFTPSACHPANAYTLRVFAPGDFSALTVPFSFKACAKRGPVYLHVTTMIAGAGIPGYSS